MSDKRPIACIIHAYPSREMLDMCDDAGVRIVLMTPKHSRPIEHPVIIEQVNVNIRSNDAVVEHCLKLNAEIGIDLVLSINESTVVQSAYAARALGLPGNSVEAAMASRNKFLAFKKLHAAGVDTPNTLPLTDPLNDFHTAHKVLGIPFIVKMADSMNSQGVFKVNSFADYQFAIKTIQKLLAEPLEDKNNDNRNRIAYGQSDITIIAQEYCEGVEFNIDVIYQRGEYSHILVFQKADMGDGCFGEKASFHPPLLAEDSPIMEELLNASKNAVEALGASVGCSHVELKHVKNRGPVIIETGLRPGGGLTVQAASKIYGINLYKDIIDVMLGNKPKTYRKSIITKSILFGGILYPKSGTLVSIQGTDQFDLYKEVKNAIILDKPGAAVRSLPEAAQPHCIYYVLEGEKISRLLDIHNELQRQVVPIVS